MDGSTGSRERASLLAEVLFNMHKARKFTGIVGVKYWLIKAGSAPNTTIFTRSDMKFYQMEDCK